MTSIKRSGHSSEYSYLYKTYKWQQIRKEHLKHYPTCKMCEEDGIATLATVCDHIEPHKGSLVKFYTGPFQSLCKLHHDSTKAREEGRGIIIGCDENGIPIDPNHHWHKKSW